MRRIPLLKTLGMASLVTLMAGCGGGGGGSDDITELPATGGSGRQLVVSANVTGDTCGERLSSVHQTFSLSSAGNGTVLDTSIFSVPAQETGGNLEASYSDSYGDCVRSYTVGITDAAASTGLVHLTTKTSCGAVVCETSWDGTFVESTSPRIDEELNTRVRGESCNPSVPADVGYRPSAFECYGNSAVLLSGRQRSNYSVVVRRDGQFNDRDPNNPTCGSNRCSPYKTQKKIELPEYQVNCLGASGYSAYYDPVNRISIKYFALITNASDPSQFEQYCLNNTEAELH